MFSGVVIFVSASLFYEKLLFWFLEKIFKVFCQKEKKNTENGMKNVSDFEDCFFVEKVEFLQEEKYRGRKEIFFDISYE